MVIIPFAFSCFSVSGNLRVIGLSILKMIVCRVNCGPGFIRLSPERNRGVFRFLNLRLGHILRTHLLDLILSGNCFFFKALCHCTIGLAGYILIIAQGLIRLLQAKLLIVSIIMTVAFCQALRRRGSNILRVCCSREEISDCIRISSNGSVIILLQPGELARICDFRRAAIVHKRASVFHNTKVLSVFFHLCRTKPIISVTNGILVFLCRLLGSFSKLLHSILMRIRIGFFLERHITLRVHGRIHKHECGICKRCKRRSEHRSSAGSCRMYSSRSRHNRTGSFGNSGFPLARCPKIISRLFKPILINNRLGCVCSGFLNLSGAGR